MIYPAFHFLVALALGLLIGLERERSKGDGPERRPAGIRTFALTSLMGAVALFLGGPMFVAIIVALVAILAGISYFTRRSSDPGLTTEMALVLTPLLGALVMRDVLLASMLAVAVAVLLSTKALIHRFVREMLSESEVEDGLLFAIATIVIWPQLPDHSVGPYAALNPHMIWLLVILILMTGAVGHIATRLFGTRYGLPLAGFVSGFVSSTATIGAMASRAVHNPGLTPAAVAGATLSTVSTFVQMALLLWAISPPTLLAMAPILAAGGLVAAAYGAAFTLRASANVSPKMDTAGRAFSIKTALILGATMAVMLVFMAALKSRFGDSGMTAGAAIAGLVDTHAAAISVVSLVASTKIMPAQAIFPVVTAMTANAVAKVVMALGAGNKDFALRIIPGIGLSMAAAWVVALVILV